MANVTMNLMDKSARLVELANSLEQAAGNARHVEHRLSLQAAGLLVVSMLRDHCVIDAIATELVVNAIQSSVNKLVDDTADQSQGTDQVQADKKGTESPCQETNYRHSVVAASWLSPARTQ